MPDGMRFYLDCYTEYVRRVRMGNITPVKVPSNDGRLYNLAGQRVGNDYRGITVTGGSKFIKK